MNEINMPVELPKSNPKTLCEPPSLISTKDTAFVSSIKTETKFFNKTDTSVITGLDTKLLKPPDSAFLSSNNEASKSPSNNDFTKSPTNLLAPLKAPKSYGTYTKQQQEQVIAFIKDGNSLRTAEKMFGIPKSTMHCWLKKLNNEETSPTMSELPTAYSGIDDSNKESSQASPLVNHTSPHANPSLSTQTKTQENPRTQIIIEEAELVRFLQSDEGVDLIAKAHNITVQQFNEFIESTKQKQAGQLRGVLVAPASSKAGEKYECAESQNHKVEVMGFVKALSQDNNTSSSRKRGYGGGDVVTSNVIVQNDNKKIKLEEDQESSPLLSLLKSNKTFKSNHLQVPKNIVLTQQQLLAARKLISNIGSSSVNTYLTTKPVLVPVSEGMNETKNYSNVPDQAELSPTYPKIINPVSIKAERTDFDTLMAPPNNSVMDSDALTTFSKMDTNITKPTFTANSNASRNLNQINRTQSEKELMALVDGDNVSADELCSNFDESLELTNWVDNETWYTDQYLQHFQVSPASVSSVASTIGGDMAHSMSDEKSQDDGDDNIGITFSSNKDKEKIISYLADGKSITSAAQKFQISPGTIQNWLVSASKTVRDIDEKPRLIRSPKFESAFYRPPTSTTNRAPNSFKSAFSKF